MDNFRLNDVLRDLHKHCGKTKDIQPALENAGWDPYSQIREEVNKKIDIFDLICHIAFDQPLLTRAERANNVKKRDNFTKYGTQARKVLEALLDKYADEGIENIEDMKILQVNPLDQFGSPLEIIELFGGRVEYQQALAELEQGIYKAA